MNVNNISKPNLEINSLSKYYKKGKVMANNNISTTFSPYEVTAIVGHNGAGKSTFLNQIIGIVKPTEGDITYNGDSFTTSTNIARNLVSMMPQFHAPLTGVTLRQSIESVLHIRGISGKKNKVYVDEILTELNIEEWANKPGEKLSGGLQRLASFAMAVINPPPIILLDEPTNDVDPVRRKLIWKYMKRLSKNGHIILVVTHNLLEVEQFADRYLLFNQGILVKDERTGEVNEDNLISTLTITFNIWASFYDLPDAIEIEYIEDEMQIILTLTAEQIPYAITWLLNLINQGKITNYKLTSASLEASYGGLTNAYE